MTQSVYEFDWPDRFVVGTVGQPGARTFFLQVRNADRLISVACEKEQSAMLAEKVDELLDQIMAADGNPYSVPAEPANALIDTDPLDEPIIEQFRAGGLTLSWDAPAGQIVVEAFPFPDIPPEDFDITSIAPDEYLQVRMPVGFARAFATRARDVVHAGRPVCQRCGQPMDSADHLCMLPDELA